MGSHEVVLLDIPPHLVDWRWEDIISVSSPTDVLYAAWAYLVHDESYYIEELNQTINEHDCRDYDELFGQWFDDAYLEWESIARAIKASRNYNLAGAEYDFLAKTLCLLLERRDDQQPFYPTCYTGTGPL